MVGGERKSERGNDKAISVVWDDGYQMLFLFWFAVCGDLWGYLFYFGYYMLCYRVASLFV